MDCNRLSTMVTVNDVVCSRFQDTNFSLLSNAYYSSKDVLKRFSRMLQKCALHLSLMDGKTVHGLVMKSGFEPDSHVWNSLVNMYAKCGSMEYAYQVFDEMPERNVVSHTALITGLIGEGCGVEAIKCFVNMKKEGILPNGFILASGLKASSMCSDQNFGKLIHGDIIKLGYLSDVFVGSRLIDFYVKCDKLNLAEKVFACMPEHDDISWNALLNGHIRIGNEKEFINFLHQVILSEIRPSKFMLSNILKCCGSLGSIREAQSVYTLAIKNGFELDGFICSYLIDLYSKYGMVEDAYKVFLRIENPDVVAWSSIILGMEQQGYVYEAAEIFTNMLKSKVQPNQFTLTGIIGAASEISNPLYGKSIHAYTIKVGFDTDVSIGNSIVTMYMKMDALKDGCKAFNMMTFHDVISWNSLLSGLQHGSRFTDGLTNFIQMLIEGFQPNKYTFVSILRSCANWSAKFCAKQLHAQVLKHALETDSFVGNALVDMYAKCSLLQEASDVFVRLLERNVFTWTVIITGYSQSGEEENALKWFRKMQQEGIKANGFTFASTLKACSSLASFETGRQFHSLVVKNGNLYDPFVASSIIDMYGKCGSLKDAEDFFYELPIKDVVLWNTIICVYSQHGHADKALKAFELMLHENVNPDGVTFIGVLSACSHVGFIDKARYHFDSLRNVYGINPNIEHYACMVDVFGRAGKFDEVEQFIKDLPFTPNALIWKTVLGACTIHKNVELGEKAAEKLIELEPYMDSTYILLSNIYATCRRWDDVTRIRSIMSRKGVKKEPGCSWIEVDGQFHIFLPHDYSHPMSHEIYCKLDELGELLSLAGYIPNTDPVLRDLTEAKKEESIMYHSERLAIAFGLISIKPGKPIRIFKNLRTCRDCHHAIKLLSSISKREIFIRDLSRFHHFHNGSCSCGDYW